MPKTPRFLPISADRSVARMIKDDAEACDELRPSTVVNVAHRRFDPEGNADLESISNVSYDLGGRFTNPGVVVAECAGVVQHFHCGICGPLPHPRGACQTHPRESTRSREDASNGHEVVHP